MVSMKIMILYLAIIMVLNFEFAYHHLINLGKVLTKEVPEFVEVTLAGGKRTNLTKYPFNVKFLNFGSLCGGTIITVKHVLTAAHCFDGNDVVNDMRVISNSESIYGLGAIFHDVWDYKIHEQYGLRSVFAYDVAVIIIHGEFKYGEKVKKAILVHHNFWMNETETTFIISGWGETENEGESNFQIIREAELRYVSHENCSKMTQSELSEDMFCLFGDGQRDTRRGDSGGGVLWNEQIVGITSHGKGINVPGVYANVFYFLPWIKNTTLFLFDQYCSFHYNWPRDHDHRNVSFSHAVNLGGNVTGSNSVVKKSCIGLKIIHSF